MKFVFAVCAVVALVAVPVSAGDVSFSFSVGSHYGSHYRGHYGGHHRHHRYRHYGHRGYYYRGYSRGYHSSYPRVYSSGCPTSYYSYRSYPSTIIYGSSYTPAYRVETYSSAPNPSRVIYAEPSRVYKTTPTVSRVYEPAPPESIVVERRAVAATAPTEDGWALLGSGNARGAATQFARAVAGDPTSDLAKVGFALSSASQGNLEQAVWAMRRALANDAGVLNRIMVGNDLRAQLTATIDRFIYASPDESLKRADASFMVAALHTILDEKAAAREATAQAIAAGDTSSAVKHLQAMLAE